VADLSGCGRCTHMVEMGCLCELRGERGRGRGRSVFVLPGAAARASPSPRRSRRWPLSWPDQLVAPLHPPLHSAQLPQTSLAHAHSTPTHPLDLAAPRPPPCSPSPSSLHRPPLPPLVGATHHGLARRFHLGRRTGTDALGRRPGKGQRLRPVRELRRHPHPGPRLQPRAHAPAAPRQLPAHRLPGKRPRPRHRAHRQDGASRLDLVLLLLLLSTPSSCTR